MQCHHALTYLAVVLDVDAELGPRLVELLEISRRLPWSPVVGHPGSRRDGRDLRLGVQQPIHRLAVAGVVGIEEGPDDLHVPLRHRSPVSRLAGAAGYCGNRRSLSHAPTMSLAALISGSPQ
jgi:hypothetical protein